MISFIEIIKKIKQNRRRRKIKKEFVKIVNDLDKFLNNRDGV